MTESGNYVSERCDVRKKGHEPRKVGSLQKLEKARKQIIPESPENNVALPATYF